MAAPPPPPPPPPHHNHPMPPGSEIPPVPWHIVCQQWIDNQLGALPGESLILSPEAYAMTAEGVAGWANAQPTMPSAQEPAFHAGFIRRNSDRQATRERLMNIIRDLATALEYTCGVGTFLVHIRGEMSPTQAMTPIQAEQMQNNVVFFVSQTMGNNDVYTDVLDHIRRSVRNNLAPMFGRDWRHRTAGSRYLRRNTLLLEPIGGPAVPQQNTPNNSQSAQQPFTTTTTPPPPPQTPRPSSRSSTTMPPYGYGFPATPSQPPPTGSQYAHAPFATSPAPSMSSAFSFSDLSSPASSPTPSPPTSPTGHQAKGKGKVKTQEGDNNDGDGMASSQGVQGDPDDLDLPQDVLDILVALHADSQLVQDVYYIYAHVPRVGWVARLLSLGFNGGTARAIARMF